MYRINETSGRLVGVWTGGRLTAADLDALTRDLDAEIERHGRLRLLFRADNFGGWDAAAFSSVARFSRRHEAHVERVAIVGASAWEACMHELLTCLTGLRAHYFLPSELGQAWAWLQSDSPEPNHYHDMEAIAMMTTSEVAERAGVNLQTVRYYERRGLIPEPPRSEAGYRQYDADYVARIRFIKRAQELGFTLDEIEELLGLRATPGASNRQVKHRAEAKIADIEAKIRDLERMKNTLKELAGRCTGEGSVADCPILHAIETTASRSSRPT